jgi:hypothetical protein
MEKLISFKIDTNDLYNLSKDSFIIHLDTIYGVNRKDFSPTESTVTFVPGDKIYFLPGVNIPRVKLKDIVLDYNIKIVRDINQATKVFTGANTYNKISDRNWSYTFDIKLLNKFLKVLKDTDLLDGYIEQKIDLMLQNPGYIKIITDYNTRRILQNSELNLYQTTESFDLAREFNENYQSYYDNTIDPDYVETIDYLSSQNLKLYDEKSLLDIINGDDALIINEDTYEKLSNMFKSSDDDNHTVAMEIMSNSNYKESLFFIELLFYNFSHKMKDNKAKNHVNFKSLVTYLNKDLRYLNTSVDDILQSLVNKKVINEEYLDKILKMFEDSIINSNRFFLVKSVTINTDIFDIIKQDYIRQVFPDREVIPPQIEDNSEELNTSEELSWI